MMDDARYTELRSLAQVDVDHINDVHWGNLFRAVVMHIDAVNDNRSHLLLYAGGRPCTLWNTHTQCQHTWHSEF